MRLLLVLLLRLGVLSQEQHRCASCWERVESCGNPKECMVSCGLNRDVVNMCTCFDQTNRTKVSSRKGSFSAMYSGAWLASIGLVKSVDWERGGALEAGSFLAFAKSQAIFRTGASDGFWLHHVSAYEHSLVARWDFDLAMEKVKKAIQYELTHYNSTIRPSFFRRTIAIIPFYGGPLDTRMTGNAHSRQPRDLKLLVLLANIKALLQSFAAKVVIVTCACSTDDAQLIRNQLVHNHTSHLSSFTWTKRLQVFDTDCMHLPKNLPFKALAALASAHPNFPFIHQHIYTAHPLKYIIFNEADQIFHWGDNQSAFTVNAFLRAFPNALITPHRHHKKYASPPHCGISCGAAVTGQNLCHANSPNARLFFASASQYR